jgi:AcrR family transcriptional regulator
MRARRGASRRSEAIGTAALQIADEHGLSKLTIRRVADAVGVPPMTLYGSIDSKEDLLVEVARRAFDDLVLAPPTRSWEDDIVSSMAALRQVMLTHPSLAQVMATQRVSVDVVGLATLMDAVLRDLERGGVDSRVIVDGMFNLAKFTIGYVLFELPRRDPESSRPRHGEGIADLSTVSRLAADLQLTHLQKFAAEVMDIRRAEYFEDGIRTLVRGLPREAG